MTTMTICTNRSKVVLMRITCPIRALTETLILLIPPSIVFFYIFLLIHHSRMNGLPTFYCRWVDEVFVFFFGACLFVWFTYSNGTPPPPTLFVWLICTRLYKVESTQCRVKHYISLLSLTIMLSSSLNETEWSGICTCILLLWTKKNILYICTLSLFDQTRQL